MNQTVIVVIAIPTNGNARFVYGVFCGDELARAHVNKWADKEHNYMYLEEVIITAIDK